jgi:predicted DNA-binding transcriptional regulator AlpA
MESRRLFLSGPRVDARYGISAMTRWRWRRDPRLNFPAPLDINGRKLWRVSDLEAWERSRATSRLEKFDPAGEHALRKLVEPSLSRSAHQQNRERAKAVGNTTSE